MNAPNNSGGYVGPLAVAGGVLAGVGGVLSSPWLLGVGLLGVAAAVGYTLRRRAAHMAAGCCSPLSAADRPAEQAITTTAEGGSGDDDTAR